MFKFFTQKQWFLWSIIGSVFIIVATWYQVDIKIRIDPYILQRNHFFDVKNLNIYLVKLSVYDFFTIFFE